MLPLDKDAEQKREAHVQMIKHVPFYAGWPHAISAIPVVKEVFDKRQK